MRLIKLRQKFLFPTLKQILKWIFYLLVALPDFTLPRLTLPRFSTPHFPRFKLKNPRIRLSVLHLPYIRIRPKPAPRPGSNKRHRFSGLFTLLLSLFFIVIVVSGVGMYFYIFQDLPSPSSLESLPIPLTTHIRDRNGTELFKIYSGQNRTLVKLSDIPQHLKDALLSIEDKEFYHHRGFSLSGSLRAAYRILSNRRLEGGSTITQQLVKTSLLSSERTLRRKIRELVLSIAVEYSYSKDQILEMYLNRVGFGGATYGIEEASQTYFGKSVSELNLAQASLLAGLPASPTAYSPFGIHPELAKARQKEVLRQMVAGGFITWDQAEAAAAQELVFRTPNLDIKAPHFVMYVKDLLAQKYGSEIVEQGGLDVITSLDLNVQEQAQQIVTQEITRIAHLKVSNGAALITKPSTGEILAMIGSRDYFDLKNDGNVNVTISPRQPGSSIKPVNYALALSRGFTASSIIDDSPITYRTPGQPSYSPLNYDNRYHGRVTLRSALANSYNIPAVKVLSANGVNNMIDLGEKMGITTWEDRNRFGLALTLGGGEVKMTEMATVYGVFANSGSKVELHPILSVRDSKGKLLEELDCSGTFHSSQPASSPATPCEGTPALDPRVAFLISDILSDNSARTPTFGPRSDLFIPDQTVAVKTGTTNNLRDNWTIGYTTDVLVAVWVGNNDNTPMSYIASGVTGASPIWHKIMVEMLKRTPSGGFLPPPGMTQVSVCTFTGQLACSGCPTRHEYFIEGTQPRSSCTEEQIKKLQENKDSQPRNQILDGVSTTIAPRPPQPTPRYFLPLPTLPKPPPARRRR